VGQRRRVVIVAFDDVQVLDVTGPAEVFAMANRGGAGDRYTIEIVARTAGPLACSSGLRLVADQSFDECRGRIDTLVVAGGNGTPAAALDADLIDWIRLAARRSRRVTSVCSGAFLLAQAGLLDGKRATTHWSVTELLADLFPAVAVDPDRIYVRDGSTYTSAGVTSGMDLALALVEDDHGSAAALELARQLVLFVHRPGGQSQFSVHLEAQAAERHPIRDAQAFIADHLAADLSVGALARQADMSTRNFARCFRNELGVTPAAYVERVRVEAARRLLESSDRALAAIASDCGFGTVETLHRSFQRTVHVTPGQYRRHFMTSRQEQVS
jgi:transcriptional regulator GlxA family with amidase domain